MNRSKKVLITFLGNIHYDTRCRNLFDSLKEKGYDVSFIGFDWLTKDFKPEKGKITIYKLKKGFLSLSFYLKFILLLKSKLFFTKYDIVFAEDIYTLPFAIISGKIKRAKIYYDSRELFGYLAGLKDKKFTQKVLSITEKLFIKKADYVITTGEMDTKFLQDKYRLKNILTLRNLPKYHKPQMKFDLRAKFGIEKDKMILIYQGVILHGRGLKIIFDLLKNVEGFVLVVIGSGEFEEYYKSLAKEILIENKVHFLGKVKLEQLPTYTAGADIGLALIENVSLSYYYTLPNKLFEYIMADIPVIVSDLPQMKEIVENYKIGFAVNLDDQNELISSLQNLKDDKVLYSEFRNNCNSASKDLNWENEVTALFKTLTV